MQHLIRICRKHLPQFLSMAAGTGYRRGGVLPSEMLCFCALSCEMEHTEVVESGRRHGFSTEVLLKCGFRTISYDIAPVPEADRRLSRLATTECLDLCMHRGSFGDFASDIAFVHQCPVLIDGPKGGPAVRIAQEIAGSVPFVAIHDMSEKSEGGGYNKGRKRLDESGLDFCVLNQEFWDEFGDLDRGAWKGQYSSHQEMTRYGFHLAIIRGEKWKKIK